MGPPRFSIDGRQFEIPSAKARALFCYLVATRQVHSRDRLAGFLWPEVPERNALASLRTALYDIRRAIGSRAGDYLFVERTRVAFVADSPHQLDVADIERVSPEHPETDLAGLERAVEAYGGEFLEGLSLPDAYDFDDWVFLERERLSNLYLNAMCRLGEHYASGNDYAAALGIALRVLAVDPLREDVHRAVMRYHAALGQRSAALAQYRACVDILDRELSIAPLEATTELHDRIVAGEPLGEEPAGPAPISRAAAARLGGERPDPLRGLAATEAMVGREDQTEILASLWRQAESGQGRVVLLSGEAGIGKTRLVGELALSLGEEPTLLLGTCYEATVSQPFAPLVSALRALDPPVDLTCLGLPDVWLRELARLLPEIEDQVPGGRNVALDGVRNRDRLFDALRALLVALTRDHPVLLLVDDAQWADETSLALLEYISRDVREHRCLIVIAFRSDELDPPRRRLLRLTSEHGSSIELQSLTAAETAELIAVLSGAAEPPERFGRRLAESTGGNPFFVVETLRALFDQGTLEIDPGGWMTVADHGEGYASLPIPESVGLVVDGRLDRLSDDSRSFLDAAAVLRRAFAFDLVQQAAGIPVSAALDALDELTQRGLVREVDAHPDAAGATYDFVHALVRDRVYARLSGARRQYLHRQLAGLLEAGASPEPEKIAYHYTRGGVRDRACAWSLRAGLTALEIHAGEDALVHFQAARELAVSSEEELAALSGMGDAFVSLGQHEDAIGSFLAALQAAPDGEPQAELNRKAGRAYERQGDFDRALEAYGSAQRCLGGQMSMTALRTADGLATVYVRLGRPAVAAGLCLDALAWLSANPGIEGARKAEAWIRNTLGMAYLHDGEHEAAVENLERSLVIKRELGDKQGEATLLNNLGVVHYRAGTDERAREAYSNSLSIKEEIGDSYGRAIALTNLALIETHLGCYDDAKTHLREAEAGAGAVGARWLLPEIKRVAAQHALSLGDTDSALELAEQSLQAAEALGVPAFIGVSHRVLGVVKGKGCGDFGASDEHFETSLAVFEMLDNEHELAKTHAAYGETLSDVGRADEAQVHIEAAIKVFESTGARQRADRLEPLMWD